MTRAPATPRLLAIGLAAGCFSGLLGVGGGTVMVPLLVLLVAFGPREATGTSLAVIVPVAIVGAGVQALYGNVDVRDGLLVGLPAVGGVLLGTWLQQRWSPRAISLLFAGLLVVVAVQLIVGA